MLQSMGSQESDTTERLNQTELKEACFKVATKLFNRRQMNVTPYILLETKALHEILNLWGGREGGRVEKHGPICSFPHPFFSFLNFRRYSPLGFGDPMWAVFI